MAPIAPPAPLGVPLPAGSMAAVHMSDNVTRIVTLRKWHKKTIRQYQITIFAPVRILNQ